MLNLLDAIITLPETAFGSGLNFLGNIIKWIVEIVPNVGLGIILFTLILKVITLPLDIYSKSAMRKNSLKMEKMRPQLEKLQKQYLSIYSNLFQHSFEKQKHEMHRQYLRFHHPLGNVIISKLLIIKLKLFVQPILN